MIRETRALDRLKFELPDAALNIALQEPKFQQSADALSTMLQQYHQVRHLSDNGASWSASMCAMAYAA